MGREYYERSAVYSVLARLGRAGLAWECLRRNARYQDDYRALANKGDADKQLSERWGIRFPGDPDLAAERAGVMWESRLNPATVFVGPVPEDFPGACRIEMLKPVVARRGDRGEFLLIKCDGGDPVPIVLLAGADDTVAVAAIIGFGDEFESRAGAARSVGRAMSGMKPYASVDDLTAAQRRHVVLALWAVDLHRSGLTVRQIAREIFGESQVPSGREWSGHPLYGQTMRLVARGAKLVEGGGYLSLLRKARRPRRIAA